MWGHEMAKKIMLTFCTVFQFALCFDFFTTKRVEGSNFRILHEGGLGILEGSNTRILMDFVIFSVANVVFGFVLVWIWKKFDGKKAQGGDDAG